jgi:hypothetical protein
VDTRNRFNSHIASRIRIARGTREAENQGKEDSERYELQLAFSFGVLVGGNSNGKRRGDAVQRIEVIANDCSDDLND